MSFVLTRDLEQFAIRTEPLLTPRLECSVMATVLIGLRRSAFPSANPLFAYSLDGKGAPVGAALRVPPHPLLTSPMSDDQAADLMRVWLSEDPQVGGVVGVPACARAIAREWERLTGGRAQVKMRQAMHELRVVREPPRPPAGHLRPAAADDRSFLIDWMGAFAAEAGVVGGADTEAQVDARLRAGGLMVWDDGGPVSML